MPADVTLVGFDFGSTTSSAVVASAELAGNSVTGRTEISNVRERLRSPLLLTPLDGERLDETALAAMIDHWLAQGKVASDEVFGGGALITGLAARRANADRIVALVRARLHDALVATADDPCLESWLAFMGSCANLSLIQPDTPFVNLDIGGGTTNLALGRGGQVLRTGCLLVGARHVQVEPGGYRISRLSSDARQVFAHLKIDRDIGQQLAAHDLDTLLDYYLQLLQAELTAPGERPSDPLADQLRQVPFRLPADVGKFAITLSGGVGELVYAQLRGEPWPTTTAFGDLGIDLARRLVASPWWSPYLRQHVPDSAGRATVYGLLRHNTEISGSTLFMPHPEQLPLPELPILGTIRPQSTADDLEQLLGFARRSARGAALRVELPPADVSALRLLGERLAGAIRALAFPPQQPLVLLLAENLGQALGQYATQWGALPVNLIVLDEVAPRDAQYARIGRLHGQVVPVSFFGLREQAGG